MDPLDLKSRSSETVTINLRPWLNALQDTAQRLVGYEKLRNGKMMAIVSTTWYENSLETRWKLTCRFCVHSHKMSQVWHWVPDLPPSGVWRKERRMWSDSACNVTPNTSNNSQPRYRMTESMLDVQSANFNRLMIEIIIEIMLFTIWIALGSSSHSPKTWDAKPVHITDPIRILSQIPDSHKRLNVLNCMRNRNQIPFPWDPFRSI